MNILTQRARKNDRIVLVIGDLGFHVIEPFAEEFPDRFLNCGIAEQNMMSVAAGMALEGDIVFVYSIGNFPTLRCLEQIRNDVCYHNANVKIIAVGGGFSYGSLGITHHTTEDLTMLRALPGMRVYAPADPKEAVMCLDDMLKFPSPCYMRLARGQDQELHENEICNITKMIPYRAYDTNKFDVSLITAGTILNEGILCEKMLAEQNIKTRIYSCPTVKPIDEDQIRDVAVTSKILVTMEENMISGGLGGAVSEILAGMSSHAVLIRAGLRDIYFSKTGSREYLRNYYGINAQTVFKKVMEMIKHL